MQNTSFILKIFFQTGTAALFTHPQRNQSTTPTNLETLEKKKKRKYNSRFAKYVEILEGNKYILTRNRHLKNYLVYFQ